MVKISGKGWEDQAGVLLKMLGPHGFSLKEAAENAEMETVDRIVDEIRSLEPGLGEGLAAMAREFDYMGIVCLNHDLSE